MTTTMPPEMSTATAPPTAVALQRDSLSRSRFMITDILAGSAAAAAAAMHNSARISPISNSNNNNNNNGSSSGGAGGGNSNQSNSPTYQHAAMQHQQQQHAAALQHYLAQQQHLLQQQHQQHQQQQHHMSQQAPPQFRGSPPLPHHLTAHHTQFPGHHPLAHLPPNALLGLSSTGAAAQAAAHYAALQQERSKLRDLEVTAVGGGGGGGGGGGSTASYDHDDRSRSPLTSNGVLNDRNGQLSSMGAGAGGGAGGGGGGGGGGGSVSGDQASTIDDSDSDSGAKDDDCNSSIKSDNLMGLSKKQRKARTAFTDHQLQTLEKSFERQKYLSVQDRMELANKLELSDCQVKTWYQNRRTKWKRQTAVGLELLAEAGNYAAFQRLYGGSPYLSAWPYAAATQSPHGGPASAIDIYYRQAAAAVALQKPLTYRMYHPGSSGIPTMTGGMPPMHPHIGASSSLSSLGSYYPTAGMPTSMLNSGGGGGLPPPSLPTAARPLTDSPAERSDVDSEKRPSSVEILTARTTPSPQLNPGSPPERTEHNRSCPSECVDDADDEDDAIEV